MHTETTVDNIAYQKVDLSDYSKNEEIILTKYIRNKKKELDSVQDSFYEFHLSMRELEQVLLSENNSNSLGARAVSNLDAHELKLLNNLYCLWETNLENRFVKFLKQGVISHSLDYPLYARFERLIQREASLLSGLNPRKLLFIGSGPMPITALCLKNHLNIQIDCLERNSNAVKESKDVMKLMGCENVINIFHGKGESIDVSGYDVVLVALLAKPKHDILLNIQDTSHEDIKIICRTSEGARAVFYEPTLDNEIPDGLQTVAHIKAGIDDTISSYLLEKSL